MGIRSAVVFLATLLSAGSVSALGPSARSPEAQGRIEINVVQVPLIVTVTDNKGALVTTLRKEDFKVYEDGRLQKVDVFARETDLPLSMILLVDNSASVIDALQFEREASMEFFSNLLKRGKDRAAVIGFDSAARTLADFTDDMDRLAEGLRKMHAGGGTAVNDAIYLSAQDRLAHEQGDRRKVIILISDGDDTASTYSLAEALTMAQKNDTVIYAISTNRISGTRGDERDRGDKAIQQIVNETGGKAYFPAKLTDLASQFQKIEEELRSQYVVSYTPLNPFNGAYRKLRVELTNGKYKARTRNGYIAAKK